MLGRTYCIQSQTTTTVCMVWTHVSDCHTAQRSLAAHSCGDGHSSPLIDVVGGRSWLLGLHPRGRWASVGAGGRLLPCAGVGVACRSSWSSIGRRRTRRGRCSLSSWVVSRCQADPKRGHAEVTWGALAVNPQWALKGGVVTLISWVTMEVVGVRTVCLQYKMTTTKLSSSSVCVVSWPRCWLGARGYVHGSGAAGHAGRRVHPLVAVGGFHGRWSSLGRGRVRCEWLSSLLAPAVLGWAVIVVLGSSGRLWR